MAKYRYTLKFDQKDERDFAFADLALSKRHDVGKVDLRPYMPPVFDQGELGSCTANALCGLRQYYAMKHGDQTELSRLYLYWHERELEGTVYEDSGARLRDGMKVLKKLGVCPEKDFPYVIERFTEKPSEQAEADAGQYKIKRYHRVRSLHELETALQHEIPVALGIAVFESIESEEVARTGEIPVPQFGEQLLGGHAILAVGYDGKHVIIRNSWGKNWGDAGYGYLPYDYFAAGLVVDM
jgi:C1A family cysteine protease